MIPCKRAPSPDNCSIYPDSESSESQLSALDFYNEPSHLSLDSPWAKLWPAVFGERGDLSAITGVAVQSTVENYTNDVSLDRGSDANGDDVYPDFSTTGRQIETWAEAAIASLVPQDIDREHQGDKMAEPIRDNIKCFGMVHSLDARLIGDMRHLQSQFVRTETEFLPLSVRTGGDFVSLLLKDGTLFSQLSDQMRAPFEAICSLPSILLEAFADTDSTSRCLEKARRQHDARIKVSVNLYGNTDVQKELGRILSAHKVYLQHPVNHKSEVEYNNPHMLSFDDLEVCKPETGHQVTLTSKSAGGPLTVNEVARRVCDCDTKDRELQGMKPDSRVKTPLLPHQEQALEFMIRKERGEDPPDFQLWYPESEMDRPGFRHAVTGLWASKPPSEVKSGILADDTGMGKTLSSLSLITGTLKNAWNWSRMATLESSEVTSKMLRSHGTLIVLSSILIMNGWQKEISDHLDGSLKVIKYHGKRRESVLTETADADIVLTTYHTLAMELRNKKDSLTSLEWFRVLLDEAHTIRRQSTTLYAAVAALHTCHRWCLTATPVQNRLEDFGSLMAFIRAEPFDRPSMFRKYVIMPFEEDDVEEAKRRLRLLCDSFCLRRNKELLDLPALEERYRLVRFSAPEKALYKQTMSRMAHARSHGFMHKYSSSAFNKFHIQLQLRLLCNHGTFQKPFVGALPDKQTQREEMINSVQSDAEIVCSCCLQRTSLYATNCASKVSQSCHHIICDECELQFAEAENCHSQAPICQFCSSTPNLSRAIKKHKISQRPDQVFKSNFPSNGHSAKIFALMEDVQKALDATKSIIFSSWTRSLDLVAFHLSRLDIAFVRIDGNTGLSRRQTVLDQFANDFDARILLMTTGTGAFGLNLTSANRIFILEPQWNPSVEEQAISRAQRYLQSRNVQVVRYLVQGTVEEDMRRQQGRKIDIAKIGFSSER